MVNENETQHMVATQVFNESILFVGDLHLHTRELRTTRKYVENNELMLNNLYNIVEEDENICMVVLLGDIQHKTPIGKNTLKETTMWEDKLIKLGKLLKERFFAKQQANKEKELADIRVILREDMGLNYDVSLTFEEQLEKELVYPLFTLQGNHDIDKDISYTFFTQCIRKGIIVNPSQIITEKLVLNFHNYGEADKVYPLTKEYANRQVVGIFHDMIPMGDLETWLNIEFSKKYPNTSSDEIMGRVDIAIVGHNHKHIPPTEYLYEDGFKPTYRNEVPTIWYVGSMGRTSFISGQIRDFGYCGLLNTHNIALQGIVEVPLIPISEFFSYEKNLKEQERRRDFKNFTLSATETVVNNHDPKQTIIDVVKDTEIQELCLEIMERVLQE